MKLVKSIIIGISAVLLWSCEYQGNNPVTVSLSGEYVIDRITSHSTDNTTNTNEQIFLPGDLYLNPYDVFPMDSIQVGFTRWHLDYNIISFYPVQNQNGQTIWQRKYFYSVVHSFSQHDLGYIKFQVNGSIRIFKIIHDGMESLTLRTSGLWPYANLGPNQSVTLHLTRIGP